MPISSNPRNHPYAVYTHDGRRVPVSVPEGSSASHILSQAGVRLADAQSIRKIV